MTGQFDAYRQEGGAGAWDSKSNGFINAVSLAMSSLAQTLTNWAIEDQIVTMIPVSPTYLDTNSFSLLGDYTSRFPSGAVVQVEAGGTMSFSTVDTSSFSVATTTVNLNDTILTNPITRVYVVATRDGLWPNGPGYVVARDYGTDRAALVVADGIAAATGKELRITHAYTVDVDVTLAAPKITVQPGVPFAISTTKTLTINGTLDAGLYQIFSCTGTGKVVAKSFKGEWFGMATAATGTVNKASLNYAIISANASATAFGTLQIPISIGAGVFNFDQLINGDLLSNVGLYGAGKTVTIFKDTHASAESSIHWMLGYDDEDANTLNDVTIDGIGFHGNGLYQTDFYSYGIGIRISQAKRLHIQNCDFKDWMAGSAYIGWGNGALSEDVYWENNRTWVVTGYAALGYYGDFCKNLFIRNNEWSQIARPISMEPNGSQFNSSNWNFIGNTVRDGDDATLDSDKSNNYQGIQIQFDAALTGYVEGVIVADNQFYNSHRTGVSIGADIYISVGNVANNNIRGLKIQNNLIHSSYTYGVFLSRVTSTSVIGNTLMHPKVAGVKTGIILLGDVSGNISLNTFIGSGTDTFDYDIIEDGTIVPSNNTIAFNTLSGGAGGVYVVATSGAKVWGSKDDPADVLSLFNTGTEARLETTNKLSVRTANDAGTAFVDKMYFFAGTSKVPAFPLSFGAGTYAAGDVTATAKAYKLLIYAEDGITPLGYIQLYAGP